MAEFSEISYENLEGELGELEEEGQSPSAADSEDDQGSEEEEPLPLAPRGSTSAYFSGPEVSDIFPQKPRRLRRGKTFGKTLPSHINEPLTLAYEAYARNDFSVATELLSLCCKLAPRLPDPYYTMALMHEQLGNLSSASMLYFLAATLSSSKAIDIWKTVFDISVKVGHFNQAFISINRLIKRKPCYDYFFLKLRLYLIYIKDERKASNLLKVIMKKFPSYDRIHVDYADICLDAFLYDRAITHYMKFVYGITGTALVDKGRLEHFKISPQHKVHLLTDTTALELLFRACSRTANTLLDIGSPLSFVDCVCLTESVIQYTEALIQWEHSNSIGSMRIPVEIVLMNACARLYRNASPDVYLACRRAVPLLERWELPRDGDLDDDSLWQLYRQRLRCVAAFVQQGLKSQGLKILEGLAQESTMGKLSSVNRSNILAWVGDIYRKCDRIKDSIRYLEEALAIDLHNSYGWVVYIGIRDSLDPISLLQKLNSRMVRLLESFRNCSVGEPSSKVLLRNEDVTSEMFSSFSIEQLGHELQLVRRNLSSA